MQKAKNSQSATSQKKKQEICSLLKFVVRLADKRKWLHAKHYFKLNQGCTNISKSNGCNLKCDVVFYFKFFMGIIKTLN